MAGERTSDLFQKMVTQNTPVQAMLARVTSTDKQNETCTVELLSEESKTIENVRLTSVVTSKDTRFMPLPASDSKVIVGRLYNGESWFVMQFGELEELVFDGDLTINDGDNGKMIIYDNLKKQLDTEKQRVSAIIDALSNSATGSQDGGATYKSNIAAVIQSLQEPDYGQSNILNDKVTH